MTFGQKLKNLREEKGFSQDNIAEMLFVTTQSVIEWESDMVLPSIDMIAKLSRIFGVSTAELLNSSDYSTKPFASFEIDYTKKKILSALKAQRHIIYTLSPIITIFVLLIYGLALYTYFTRMADIVSNMIIEKIFTIVWCTIITMIVVSIVAFFTTFEIIRFRKAKAILNQMPHHTKVNIYQNRLEYAAENENIITVPFSELKSIKETEEYYFITCKNKQMIILDKSKSEGYHSYLASIAYMYNIYSQNLISDNGKFEKLPSQKLTKIKNQSIRLIPFCIASIYIFIIPVSMCLPAISSATGSLKILLKILCLILTLLSNVFPIYSIIFGAMNKSRKLKTVKNIIIGCITLFYSAIFSLGICLSLITLN